MNKTAEKIGIILFYLTTSSCALAFLGILISNIKVFAIGLGLTVLLFLLFFVHVMIVYPE
jgi:hypothetical protein